MKLKGKFILNVSILASIMLLVMLGFFYYQLVAQSNLIFDEDVQRVDLLSLQIEQRFQFYLSDLVVLQNVPPIQGIARTMETSNGIDPYDGSTLLEWKNRLKQIFLNFAQTRPQYAQIEFIGTDPQLVFGVERYGTATPQIIDETHHMDTDNVVYEDITPTLLPGDVYFSEINLRTSEGGVPNAYQPILRLATPLHNDTDGAYLGTIILTVNANDFFSYLIGSDHAEHLFLLDKDGYVIVDERTGENSYGKLLGGTPDETYLNLIKTQGDTSRGDGDTATYDNGNTVAMYHTLQYQFGDKKVEPGLILGSIVDKGTLFGTSFRGFLLNFSVFALVIGILTAILYLLFVQTLIRRVTRNAHAIRKISSGNYKDHIVVEGSDEISEVAQGINHMMDALDQHEEERKRNQKILEKKAEEYKQLNDSLSETQKAVLNILDDLKKEKEVVEERVKERTRELEVEKEKLSTIAENMQAGAMLVDNQGQLLFANREMYTILDLPYGDSNILPAFFKMSDDIDTKTPLITCLADAESHTIPELEFKERIYEIIFSCLIKNDVKTAQYLGNLILVRDVTDERLLERSKSELVAVASHQLRTPLTAIRGNIEMLIDENFGGLNKEQHELLEDIEVSSIRLISMVNDMLDITKIEKGSLDLNFESFDLEEIIVSIIGDLKDYAEKHNVTVEYEAPSVDSHVFADRMRTRQIFQNLIDNAIKYSRPPEGKLHISYQAIDDGHLQVTLADNGIGIPASEQSKMFKRFYRASNTSSLASSGSGLGLYIVKSVIEIMNGLIRFESKENEGTTFFVVLPIKEEKPQ